MARPPSHREYPLPEKRCGNCKHCILMAYKNDHICFYGEEIEDRYTSHYPIEAEVITLKGGQTLNWENRWGDNSHYDKVWGGGIVDPNWEVCDCWEPATGELGEERI